MVALQELEWLGRPRCWFFMRWIQREVAVSWAIWRVISHKNNILSEKLKAKIIKKNRPWTVSKSEFLHYFPCDCVSYTVPWVSFKMGEKKGWGDKWKYFCNSLTPLPTLIFKEGWKQFSAEDSHWLTSPPHGLHLHSCQPSILSFSLRYSGWHSILLFS